MAENPYADKLLREAWTKGAAAGRKRHANRDANPYFNATLKDAWNQGFDSVRVERHTKQRLRMI